MTEAWKGVLEDIRRTRTQRGRESCGHFAIEGIRLHERALRSGNAPTRALVSETLATDTSARIADLMKALPRARCEAIVAPDSLLAELVAGRGLGDIVGLVPIPRAVGLAAAIDALPDGGHPIVLAVDIFDPGNCGALVRTSLAGGASLFVAAGDTDPYHPKAVQTSMGSLFKIPVIRAAAVREAIRTLREVDVYMLALDCNGSTDLPSVDIPFKRCAITLGSEAYGLSEDVIRAVDTRVRIPMPEGVDSFSVNAAAAIALYELDRRSRTRPLRRPHTSTSASQPSPRNPSSSSTGM